MILRLLSVALLVFAAALGAGPAWAQTGTAVATDDFASTTNVALGANWLNLNTINAGSITKQSGVFAGSTGVLNPATAVWVGAGSFTDDQYSKITIVSTFGANEYGVGVICRASTDTEGSRDYYVHYASTVGTSWLWKVVNGTVTQLATGSVAWAAGNVVGIRCIGAAVEAWRNNVALGGSFTHSCVTSCLSTGKPGIAASGDSFVETGDSWEGGNLTAGGSGPPLRSLLGVGL